MTRPPKEEGEAARNNVVMSAGKRSCPDMICYLLFVVIVTISRVSHVDTLEGRAFESRGRCVMAIWIDRGDIPLRNSVTPAIPHISVG